MIYNSQLTTNRRLETDTIDATDPLTECSVIHDYQYVFNETEGMGTKQMGFCF